MDMTSRNIDADSQTQPNITTTPITLKSSSFTNGTHKRQLTTTTTTTTPPPPPPLQQQPPSSSMVVSYKECLKNHAASLGGHALDGCGEFMPPSSLNPNDPRSLKCAACGCHRNFHRREPQEHILTTITSTTTTATASAKNSPPFLSCIYTTPSTTVPPPQPPPPLPLPHRGPISQSTSPSQTEKHVKAIVWEDEEVDFEHLSKMSNLRLLILNRSMNITGRPWSLSNELRYVKWDEYPFKYLPSSFHPNELVELHLRRSKIKQLWKNKKYLPNLRTLDLSNSKELEKIIDFGEFPNLKWLNLEGCTNLVELDPSIGLLRNLVYLNLDGCYNLVNIPNTIFGLGSLEDLNISCCSKVFNKPIHLEKNKKSHYITESASHSRSMSSVFEWTMLLHHSSFSTPTTHTSFLPSLRSLHCLRKVDISFCHLSQVPDAIECLHWLERLNLGGNNFVTLPSLRKLSKLVYLNLEHCKLLECLPQLPSPTTMRERDEFKWYNIGSKMLESYCIRLVIFNCPKLGERECCYSMTFSWMKQFIMANPQPYFTDIQMIIPGSEIPSWINNQCVGDSIQIDKSPIMHGNNNNIIGCVCCAVFTMAPHQACFSSANMKLRFNDPIKLRVPVILNVGLVTTKSSHLWIIYVPREFILRKWRSDYFEKMHFKNCGDVGMVMEVKSCGYRWVCKQDLEEFNLIMMNHENSLTLKGKILEIEDEMQPQPQPEQESFISQVMTDGSQEGREESQPDTFGFVK